LGFGIGGDLEGKVKASVVMDVEKSSHERQLPKCRKAKVFVFRGMSPLFEVATAS
jgi:hypothetical protein